jgi:hypothetical protein
MSKKILFEEFIQRVRAKHGDNFEILKSDFITLKHPLSVFCKIHKVSIKTNAASHVIYHNPCKQCIRDKRLKDYVQKVLSAMRENFPDLELLSDIPDFNCEVTICCPKHGKFKSKTDSIIFNRMGCFKCGREATRIKNTGKVRVNFQEFKTRFTERYGSRLILLSDESDYQNTNSILTVKCSDPTHSEFRNTAKNLLRYQGCKNCKESWGERLVRLALEELGIEYEQEKRFASCRDKKELPFDFWLPKFSTLIEFQGKQHQVSAERFGGSKMLLATQKRDKIKEKWVSDNGINLIYIYDYKEVKKTILKNLKPAGGYNPTQVLEKVSKSDDQWISQKWSKYLRKLNNRHKGRYDFTNSSWSWGQKKIDYICPEHGERTGDLQNLIKGHGCSLCAHNEMTLELVVERSKIRFGDQFNFTNSIFKGMKVEMEIVCKTHGAMHITPNSHFNLAKGCRECVGKAKDFSPSKFLTKANSKFGNRFDYSKLGYFGADREVTIRCKSHNLVFKTLPADHIRNDTGCCPKCVKESKSKTHSKTITVKGIEHSSMTAAAEYYGLQRTTVYKRIKMGWDMDKAFTTPKK